MLNLIKNNNLNYHKVELDIAIDLKKHLPPDFSVEYQKVTSDEWGDECSYSFDVIQNKDGKKHSLLRIRFDTKDDDEAAAERIRLTLGLCFMTALISWQKEREASWDEDAERAKMQKLEEDGKSG